MMIDSINGENAGLGDIVCLIDKNTMYLTPTRFIVLGIAHRPGPDKLMRKYLYLSDGNGVHLSDEVRVVVVKENSQEYESEQGKEYAKCTLHSRRQGSNN